MDGKNINYGVNYGHIGDQLNIYQYINVVLPMFKEVLEDGLTDNSEISYSHQTLLTLELFNEHSDMLEQEFRRAIKDNRYPLKIRVTQLVDDCAQGVYYNNGNVNADVWRIVDSVVTLVCYLTCGSNFYANRVRIGSHLYYELYPA
ncbi:MAG: hypothetical protein NC131_10685 [Roseburia sp.]|nr:hypothetical protein [Roseburia sp.]